MLEQFHFIRPLWLLALLPLALLLWRISRQAETGNPWRKIVDPRLLPLLIGDSRQGNSNVPLHLLAIGWLVAVLALADPSWEQLPQPVMQTSTARVIVLDLSRSMLATDLQPTRLVRARFKVEDILNHSNEGQTGLVVFAGDAFSVTPLTRDTGTLRAQLKALEPEIMPAQGSRADLGLLKAAELLRQAGVARGQVILIADGVEGNTATQAAARLRQAGYRVSVLGVGTAAGAPLPDGQGGMTRDASGKTRLVRLDSQALQAVAQAGGGRYRQLTSNQADINALLDDVTGSIDNRQARDLQTQRWKEQGPLLAILLLPLAALAFRRGWLLSVLVCTAMFSQPQPAMAFSWNDLWQRTDQQAAQALQQGRYEQAARLAADPAQRGSAEYRMGDYRKALDSFSKAAGPDAAYNRGNALAKQGNYEQAIAAYDEALKTQPDMEDAAANKAAVEALLQKQRQDRQDASGQQDEQDQQADGNESSSGTGNSKDQQQGENNNTGESAQGGNNESPVKGTPSSEGQSADGDSKETQGDDKDNAFADAGTQQDEDKADRPDDAKSAAADNGTETETGTGTDAASDNEAAAQEQEPTETDGQQTGSSQAPARAEALTSEEQLAAQQWLRRIPDDPGGLLRRKFLYQYRQRSGAQQSGTTQNW